MKDNHARFCALIDKLGASIMLIGAEAEIVFANRAARRLLDDDDGLRLHGLPGGNRFQLHAATAAAQAKIDALLQQAVDADKLATLRYRKPVAIQRPSGRSPYVMQLSSLSRRDGFGDFGDADISRAILFLTDTARALVLDTETLICLFGLTTSEARLAVTLGEGMGLREAADVLEVSHNTAKSQLQQVYQKTGVDTRARLMKLLMALAHGCQ